MIVISEQTGPHATVLAIVAAVAPAVPPSPAVTGGPAAPVTTGSPSWPRFYPLQFLAERVGGDRVRVTNLAKPGAEPHDLELYAATSGRAARRRPRGVPRRVPARRRRGDQGHARPRTAPSTSPAPSRSLDAPEGAEEEATEDTRRRQGPARLARPGPARRDRRPPRRATGQARPATTPPASATAPRRCAPSSPRSTPSTRTGLATCQRRDIVTSHAAFGYLADRYGLTQIPISGLSPDEEPTPQRVAEVAALARQNGVTTIFFETLVSPKIAQTIADRGRRESRGARPDRRAAPEAAGADYLSVMRHNLGKLRTALGCTMSDESSR